MDNLEAKRRELRLRIFEILKRNGLKKAELVKKAKISKSVWSRVMNLSIPTPTLATMGKLERSIWAYMANEPYSNPLQKVKTPGTYSRQELEYWILFSVVVAGKAAPFAHEKMGKFLGDSVRPFEFVRRLIRQGNLMSKLKDAKTGNYHKISKAFEELSSRKINLKTCAPEQLEEIYGIAMKTSRFFILLTRKDAPYAALDTHILKWLYNNGYKVP
ncbi:MAG TPA: hypothetical protein VFX22_10725, partial [Candidatus Kapabacteria bacterium]|nr:hypothetical protein [Candidatus Kapabacteria bacterium]